MCKRDGCGKPGFDRDLTPYGYPGQTTIACDEHWEEWVAAQPPPLPEALPEPEPEPAPAPAPEVTTLSDEDRKKIIKSLKRLAKQWAPHIVLSDDFDVLWLMPEEAAIPEEG